MAETAKIINPDKTVVLPDKDAGCSLEESCPADELEAFLQRERGPKNYYVISYINSSAAVKALSDVICTSGNAVTHRGGRPGGSGPSCSFPDQNLGEWVSRQTGRTMDFWEGNCYIHVEFTRDSISRRSRRNTPTQRWWPIPECTAAVTNAGG